MTIRSYVSGKALSFAESEVAPIRQRSDEIEASFLKGVAVEYLTDQAWESDNA